MSPAGEIRAQFVVATTEEYPAVLDGAQEVPPTGSRASGSATLHLHQPGNVLTYDVQSRRLSNVLAAHLHQARARSNGPVVHTLDGAGGAYCGVTGKLTAAEVAALQAGGMYLNIHTAGWPGGRFAARCCPSPGCRVARAHGR